MRTEFVGLALVLSLLAVDPAVANPAGKTKKDDPNQETVCKTEGFVGSRIRERVCKTRGEWDQARKDGQEILDTKGRGLGSRPGASGTGS